MRAFSEHRLCSYTLDSIERQRENAGASPLTSTVLQNGVLTGQQPTDARNLDQRVLPGQTQTQGQQLVAAAPPQPVTQPQGTTNPDLKAAGINNAPWLKSANTSTDELRAAGINNAPWLTQDGAKKAGDLATSTLPSGTDAATYQRVRAEAEKQYYETEAARTDLQNKQSEKKPTTAAPQPTEADPMSASLQGLANTPETKALLSLYDQQQKDIEGLRSQNDTNLSLTRDTINDANDRAHTRLQAMEDSLKQSSEQMKGLMDTIHTQNQEALDKQQKAESDRLEWEAQKQTRTLSQQEVRQHQALVAQIALGGGFGQEGALAAVAASDADFESKIREVQSTLGMDKITLAAKYSGLYVENNNNYLTKSLENAKDLESKLMTIGGEENTLDINEATATAGLVRDWWAIESQLQMKKGENTMNVVKDLNALIYRDKADKLQAEHYKEEATWRKDVFDQEQQYKYDALDAAKTGREDAATDRADDKAFNRMLTQQQRVSGRIAQDKVIQGVDEANQYFVGLDAAYDAAVTQKGKNFTDQVLVSSYNKLTDPHSVVRESEYARSAAGLSLIEGLRAKYESFTAGGILTDAAREELKAVATTLNDSWQMLKTARQERYYSQIDSYNMRAPADYQLTYEEFGLPEHLDSGERSSYDGYMPPGYQSPHSSGNPYSGGGEQASLGSFYTGDITQNFNTPAKSREEGGLYDAATVKAWGGKHSGLDIKMPVGTPLPAPTSLTVVEAGLGGDWGNTVLGRATDGALIRFSHLSRIDVKEGDTIPRGKVFASSGNTGNSHGAHLDLRVKVNGKYVDPLKYSLPS